MTLNLMTTLPSLALSEEDAERHLHEQHPGALIKTFFFQGGEAGELPGLIRRRYFDLLIDRPDALGVVVVLESVRSAAPPQEPREFLAFKFFAALPTAKREIIDTLGKGQPVHLAA